MCKQTSGFWRIVNDQIEVFVEVLDDHSETENHLPGKNSWSEMHYLPSGGIECRTEGGRSEEAEEMVRARWPSWYVFFQWALIETNQAEKYDGYLCLDSLTSLPGPGCLPKSVGGGIYIKSGRICKEK